MDAEKPHESEDKEVKKMILRNFQMMISSINQGFR